MFSSRKKARKGSKRRSSTGLGYESLESRKLLAGITLDTATGVLTVFGDADANAGRLDVENGQFKAQVTGTGGGTQFFPLNSINEVIFVGFAGNDSFVNSTSVPGKLYGHTGNDTLTGGSAADTIVGGDGADIIRGGAGDDTIHGMAGNDEIHGEGGNDHITASSGTNTVEAGAGNDTVFGGDGVDTINGGAGIDQIFSWLGDDIIDSGSGGTPGGDLATESELIQSGPGADRVTTGTGWNRVFSGTGDDTLIGSTGVDWFINHGGNDNMSGGDGDDYFRGYAGNNTVNAGNGNDALIMTGTEADTLNGDNGGDLIRAGFGNDIINGGSGNDTIEGSLGDDTIQGGNGNDNIAGEQGNDTIDTGAGTDIANFAGNDSGYKITAEGSNSRVVLRHATIGQDVVINAETLGFANTNRQPVANVTRFMQINPIVLSNTNGSNTATFFGASEQEIKDEIDFIFYEAGIDVQWLTQKSWNSTYGNVGSGSGTRTQDDANWLFENGDISGPGHSNDLIIDSYFVRKAPGFPTLADNQGVGIAAVDDNGVAIYIGADLPNSEDGIGVTARLFAHEVAHNLGLQHIGNGNTSNLMEAFPTGSDLNNNQISTIQASRFSRDV